MRNGLLSSFDPVSSRHLCVNNFAELAEHEADGFRWRFRGLFSFVLIDPEAAPPSDWSPPFGYWSVLALA